MADGTTRTVPYVAGTGWTLPTSPAVSEIDIPPFTQEGANTFAVITFHVTGYASPAAVPGHILTNTTSVNAYLSGTSTAIKTAQGQSASILVADPAANGDGALTFATFSTAYSGGCVERVQPTGSGMEITQAPSKAIYLDYLAPAGVGTIAVPALSFTLTGGNGKTFTATGVVPTRQVTDYNGTGRTLIEWTIPAGLATVPGFYTLGMTGFDVNLGAGCAGTFQNAMTVGYGAVIPGCAVSGVNQTPPVAPAGDPALNTNGSPIAGNYCGASAPLKVTATNPGFSVDKQVQGNLDPAPIGSGGTGHVSAAGGTASYTISFTNTGQSTLANPVMYDLLPRVGDTRATSTAPRNSQFPVTLEAIATLPAGLTVAYSQAANPCRPEVLATDPGCVDDWSAVPPSPLSAATALRFTYTGNVLVSAGFTATYTVSTPPSAAGNVAWNSIGTNVTAGDTLLGAAESSLTGLQAQSAQPAITKTADRSTVDAVGQPIVYTFTVTNNTAVTLGNVRVADALVDSAASSVAPTASCASLSAPAAPCSGAVTSLAPGQVATFTATYLTTQADLDHGGISDQATATADPPTGPGLSNSSGVVTVAAQQTGALALVKSASPGTVDAVGDVVDYTFRVTNTGNVTLHGIGIDELSFGGSGSLSAISCPPDALAPGQSVECTASYPVTQSDLTAGSIANTAAATALDPSGAPVTSSGSSATVTVDQLAGLAVVKSATPSEAAAYNAGQVITYSYVVSNTGNVPVSGITVDEVSFTGSGALSAIDCPGTSLAPAGQFTCTATYTLTQADVDSGSLVNTAHASGTAPSGPVVSGDSTVTTPQTPLARLTLTKTADTGFVNAAGDAITYTFAVVNSGNVTIHGVHVEETAFSGSGGQPAVTCPASVLVPGQRVDCTATYTVTAADMDAGSVVNTARAVGSDPADTDVASALSTATVTANAAPALTLVKSAGAAAFDAVGDPIGFSFLITNSGNVTVTGIGVIEDAFSGSGPLGDILCPTTDLAAGESATCTADYAATQADLDRGGIDNTATALGQGPDGAPVLSDPSTVAVAATQAPALALQKTVSPGTVDAAGDTVTYTFHVTNTGNTTLSGIAIAETAFSGAGVLAAPDCGAAPLAPGADRTCTATYHVTQADVDAGTLTNTAVASAGAVDSSPSTATVTIDRAPALTLVKSAQPAAPADFRAGQTITYSFVITNTGNVTITGAGVQEGAFSGSGPLPAPACPSSGPLAPGAQLVCSTAYTVTQADIDSGSVTNSATATGTGPSGVTPPTSPVSTASVPEPAKPALALQKTTDVTRITAAGQQVPYTFTVTNTGNTTASGISIVEGDFTGHGPKPVVTCAKGLLVPGQSLTCTAVYTVVSADLDGSVLSNTATATAGSPGGGRVGSGPSSASVHDVASAADPSGLPSTGSIIGWGAGLIGAVLILSGTLLIAIRRRRGLTS
ncbi:LPXTG cell wall anchor domain-containing protein [Leifsonia sp. C5G2]|uniref:DUF7507 domain-containing protein n=1 Tax=Leifsonia sp. C5G2 TaxID=2735269 RepID=UPI00158583B2|nr:LPXTG cell wall anchor domain-containing protein [Leifsonia sp. C5G2]NUU07252.1 DUF11 domain-containing protein [Leifsonia sp. C5G2]